MSVTLTRDEADELIGVLRAYADGKPLKYHGVVNRAVYALEQDGYGQTTTRDEASDTVRMSGELFRQICEERGVNPDTLLGEGRMVAGRLETGPVSFSFTSAPPNPAAVVTEVRPAPAPTNPFAAPLAPRLNEIEADLLALRDLLRRALTAGHVLETMLRTADLPRGREVAAKLVADLEKALGVS